MISLRDDLEPEPCKPGMPAAASEDIEFWKSIFAVLLPPAESDEVWKSDEQEG